MDDLDILPIKQQKLFNTVDYPPHLPDINNGSILTIIAPPKSGKSVLISNLFLRKSMYRDKFDKIYIFSTTALNGDNSTRFLVDDDDIKIFNSYSDKVLQDILDYQEQFPIEERPRISIVFDDFLSFPGIRRNSLMFTLASMYRHYGIKLLVYSSQIYRGLPPIVRQSTDYFIMFNNGNAREVEKIYDEVGSRFGSRKKFFELLYEATEEPYNFLYLDLYNKPPLVYRNFKTLIYTAPKGFRLD